MKEKNHNAVTFAQDDSKVHLKACYFIFFFNGTVQRVQSSTDLKASVRFLW